jgi:hypothetical protein
VMHPQPEAARRITAELVDLQTRARCALLCPRPLWERAAPREDTSSLWVRGLSAREKLLPLKSADRDLSSVDHDDAAAVPRFEPNRMR